MSKEGSNSDKISHGVRLNSVCPHWYCGRNDAPLGPVRQFIEGWYQPEYELWLSLSRYMEIFYGFRVDEAIYVTMLAFANPFVPGQGSYSRALGPNFSFA